jgi:hypothetical protein
MSHRPIAIAFLTGAIAGAAAGAAPAQSPTVRLNRPEATLPEAMSRVAGLRELSDGRLIVSDITEQSVSRVDFTNGTVTTLGRRGAGPGEYEMPGELFDLPGDSTLLLDRANQRISTVLPDGRISDVTRPLRGPNGWPLMLRAVDARGQFYFDLAGIMMPGLEETAAKGMAPIYRWDPNTDVLDSVGVVKFPPLTPGGGPGLAGPRGRGGVNVRVSIGGEPYRGRDEWGVLPDGRIAVARFEDYHVEWIGPNGVAARGPAVRYAPVPVTQAEKDAWADQMASRGLIIQEVNGRRTTTRPPRPDPDQQEWPEVMPPFLNGSVRVTPEGEVWVRRAAPVKERRATHDVFDSHGRLVRQVILPENRRLVGFGKGVLYAVRVDEDDLEWLERYQMP